MVVQKKKQKGEIRICVDLRKLNDACVHDPFLTPFTDEVLDNVGRQEAYSFTYGIEMTFAMDWGCFLYIERNKLYLQVPT